MNEIKKDINVLELLHDIINSFKDLICENNKVRALGRITNNLDTIKSDWASIEIIKDFSIEKIRIRTDGLSEIIENLMDDKILPIELLQIVIGIDRIKKKIVFKSEDRFVYRVAKLNLIQRLIIFYFCRKFKIKLKYVNYIKKNLFYTELTSHASIILDLDILDEEKNICRYINMKEFRKCTENKHRIIELIHRFSVINEDLGL